MRHLGSRRRRLAGVGRERARSAGLAAAVGGQQRQQRGEAAAVGAEASLNASVPGASWLVYLGCHCCAHARLEPLPVAAATTATLPGGYAPDRLPTATPPPLSTWKRA